MCPVLASGPLEGSVRRRLITLRGGVVLSFLQRAAQRITEGGGQARVDYACQSLIEKVVRHDGHMCKQLRWRDEKVRMRVCSIRTLSRLVSIVG